MTVINKPSKQNYVSMKEAARAVESGDVIWLGSKLSISNAFLSELAKRRSELRDVTLISNMYINPLATLQDPKYKKAFHFVTFKNNHGHITSDAALAELICESFNVNTIAIEVCSPDENGNCNLGIYGAGMTPYINKSESIKKRIAVINSQQPKAAIISNISLRSFDYIVENHHRLFAREVPTPPIYCATIA